MSNLYELAKKLIKEGCKEVPKPNKEQLIIDVVVELSNEEPMMDKELIDWEIRVREIVNNYY